MKKKVLLLIATGVLTVGATSAMIATKAFDDASFAYADTLNNYWNHYQAVEPTLLRHGSKEFWADCSTHTFTLVEPVGVTIREGVPFNTTTYFDELEENDPRYVARINIDIKAIFSELLLSLTHSPYSFIPDTMRPEGVQKYSAASLEYNFDDFVSVSDIKYGGFGEQWHMVIDNIKESQRFYNVTTYGSEIIGAANLAVMSFLDNNEDPVVSWTHDETNYRAKLTYENGVLDYTIKFKTGISVPLFGDIIPQLDMNYVVSSNTKTVRFQLGEGNALKFVITPDTYTFALEYGIETVSRKAYFSIEKDDEDNVEGHIYEFIQYKDKDLVGSCADFYIGEDYTSVVGNKASGIKGLKGYITELCTTSDGLLRGYEVKETISLINYNTLWFNLNDVSGFTSIKAIGKESFKENENPHYAYINSSGSVFEPTYNKILGKDTSRKYDLEMRTQYFYGYVDTKLTEFEVSVPMLFVQAGDNYNSYTSDIQTKSHISSTISCPYVSKIESDYATLIDIFLNNKDNIKGKDVEEFIGDPRVI